MSSLPTIIALIKVSDNASRRASVVTRINAMMDIGFNEPFFDRGDFPPTVFNGTTEIPVPNPWGLSNNTAPFDQRSCIDALVVFISDVYPSTEFFLIMDVAVGGTNGWFPDNVGGKPWLDQSDSKFDTLCVSVCF